MPLRPIIATLKGVNNNISYQSYKLKSSVAKDPLSQDSVGRAEHHQHVFLDVLH